MTWLATVLMAFSLDGYFFGSTHHLHLQLVTPVLA